MYIYIYTSKIGRNKQKQGNQKKKTLLTDENRSSFFSFTTNGKKPSNNYKSKWNIHQTENTQVCGANLNGGSSHQSIFRKVNREVLAFS